MREAFLIAGEEIRKAFQKAGEEMRKVAVDAKREAQVRKAARNITCSSCGAINLPDSKYCQSVERHFPLRA